MSAERPARFLSLPVVLPVVPLVLLGLLTGIGAALLLRPLPWSLLWLLPALLTLLPFTLARPRAALGLMPLVFLLLGWQHTAQQLAGPQAPRHIDRLVPEGQPVTLLGRVEGMPEFDGRHSRFVLACEAYLPREGPPRPEGADFVPAEGLVRLTLAGPPPPTLEAGQRLLAMTRLDRPRGYRTPGAYDRAFNLAIQDIFRIGFLESPLMLESLPTPQSSWRQRLRYGPERLRAAIAGVMEQHLPPATAALYQGLVIGNRAAIPLEVIEDFKASGCMHILAISGMHLSLLALMTGWCLTWLLQRSEWLMLRLQVRVLAAALTMPILLGYTLLAGGQLPVLRALVMALLVTAALLLRRRHDMLHLLCVAALGLLLWQPLALGSASFQLSFAAVLGLIVVQPRLQPLLRRHDPESPMPLPERPPLPERLGRILLVALLVSVSATLATLPIMLYHFNQFSLVGPLANLLVEPLLSFWALPLGLLAIVLMGPAPELAALLLQLGGLGIDAAVSLCHLAAAVPLARLHCITPSPWEILGFYGLLALLCWRPRNTRHGVLLLAVALLSCLLPATVHGLRTRWDRGMTVWYLDVGQGSASVVELPGGRTVLVDGGGSSAGPSVGERVIAPFLWRRRHLRLDEVVLTHPDSDHTNGIDYVLRHFRPRSLWVNGLASKNPGYERLLATAGELGIPVLSPAAGQMVAATGHATLTVLDNPVRTEALAMTGGKRPAGNESGLALRLRLGEQALLFPGDIGAVTEARVARANTELHSQVLLAAHHGSKGSNSTALLEAVRPSHVIVSAGHGRQAHFPAPIHLQRWQEAGRQVFVTGRDGTIHCRVTADSLLVRPWDAAPPLPRR